MVRKDTLLSVVDDPKPATKNDPPDVVTAGRLGRLISSYAAGSESRPKLAIIDSDQLGEMLDLLTEFRALFYSGDRWAAAAATAIVEAVEQFVAANKATEKETVAGIEIETAVIERANFRAKLAKIGADLAAKVEAYAAERRQRIGEQTAREWEADNRLEEAKKVPMLSTAVLLLEQATEMLELEPNARSWGVLQSTFDAARRAIECIAGLPPIAAKVPPGFNAVDIAETIKRHAKRKALAARSTAAA